jgi:hypothetical protein
MSTLENSSVQMKSIANRSILGNPHASNRHHPHQALMEKARSFMIFTMGEERLFVW